MKRNGADLRTVITLIFCILITPAVADERDKLGDIVGRWIVTSLREGHQPKAGRIFDFTPCAEGWCGVEVDEGGKCGRTSIRIKAEKDGNAYYYRGTYSVVENLRPLTVIASPPTRNADNALITEFAGYFGEYRDFSSRSFPLEFLMSRQGDAVCKADAKTS